MRAGQGGMCLRADGNHLPTPSVNIELKTSYKLLYIEFKRMDPGSRQTAIGESAALPFVTLNGLRIE